MKTVAFVPIKLNNERLPNKNILPLGGKPLFRHMLDTLLSVTRIDDIHVFCSDEAIAECLPDGVRFLRREKELDAFTAGHYDIVRSFLSKVDADIYVNAHATNPFISAKTVETGIEKILTEGYDSALAVLELREHLWRGDEPFNFTREDPPRTQDLVPLYAEVGLFMYRKEVFERTGTRYGKNPYLLRLDKIEATDINYAEDYELAEAICVMRGAETDRADETE
jgi:CMP-N-acetylneuraminic acid synthetase